MKRSFAIPTGTNCVTVNLEAGGKISYEVGLRLSQDGGHLADLPLLTLNPENSPAKTHSGTIEFADVPSSESGGGRRGISRAEFSAPRKVWAEDPVANVRVNTESGAFFEWTTFMGSATLYRNADKPGRGVALDEARRIFALELGDGRRFLVTTTYESLVAACKPHADRAQKTLQALDRWGHSSRKALEAAALDLPLLLRDLDAVLLALVEAE